MKSLSKNVFDITCTKSLCAINSMFFRFFFNEFEQINRRHLQFVEIDDEFNDEKMNETQLFNIQFDKKNVIDIIDASNENISNKKKKL